TLFLYYDIGDPAIDYVDMKTGPTHKEGQIVVFLSQDRLVLTRAEIKKEENIPDENLSQLDNDIKIVDTDFSDGITVFPNDEFSIFGVVKPIPSLVKPTEFAYTYEIANRISRIHYRIKKSDGSILLDTIKDVSLGRIFDPSQPKNVVISLYEFKHEFHLSIDPGTYAVEMVGLDMQFKEVPETKEVFVVNSVSGNETKMPKNE
ncbi:MAG: hypothetical protein NTX88_04715, partial [Candidatus Atribacteria bacterium]|nr:hypothetical protein [Candidatus Atribacteria bacterium]